MKSNRLSNTGKNSSIQSKDKLFDKSSALPINRLTSSSKSSNTGDSGNQFNLNTDEVLFDPEKFHKTS